MDNSIKQALSQFGINENTPLRYEKPNSQNMQTWEIEGNYFIKRISKDKAKAERIVALNMLLRYENVPVARYHQTKTGDVCACVDGYYYILADKLPGTSHRWWELESNAEKRAYALGKNLAQLHLALKKLDGQFEAWDNNIMNELHGWILTEIRDKQIPVKQEVIDYCISFSDLYHHLPRQFIHRDPHGGNFLWVNDEITGVIDFDLTEINSRVFDLHYAFGPNEKYFDKWLKLRSYFFSGYHGVSHIRADEMVAYPYMSVFIDLLCLAFWSIQNREDKPVEDALRAVHWMYDNRNEITIHCY